MRIAFLILNAEAPSSRYRILQYLSCLRNEGYQCEVFAVPSNLKERFQIFRQMRNFDIVVLQKKLFGYIEVKFLRRHCKILVYDFDDAVMYRDSHRKKQYSRRRQQRFNRMVKTADWVIAGNEYLREQVGHSNVSIIPSPIDMERYSAKTYDEKDGRVTLGWIGSKSTLPYLLSFQCNRQSSLLCCG